MSSDNTVPIVAAGAALIAGVALFAYGRQEEEAASPQVEQSSSSIDKGKLKWPNDSRFGDSCGMYCEKSELRDVSGGVNDGSGGSSLGLRGEEKLNVFARWNRFRESILQDYTAEDPERFSWRWTGIN